MWGCLRPPLVEIGERITDPALLRELESLRGDAAGLTALARRIGADHGLPDADHFYVSPEGFGRPRPLRDERGLLIASVARHVEVDE